MKLTFLGSGGGRFSAISQRRMTGGFRIDNLGGKNYHIDPGPGALIRTASSFPIHTLTIITMPRFSSKR